MTFLERHAAGWLASASRTKKFRKLLKLCHVLLAGRLRFQEVLDPICTFNFCSSTFDETHASFPENLSECLV